MFENTSHLSGMCFGLVIPGDRRDVTSAAEYYSKSSDPRKIRKMIWRLDQMGDTALADSMMEYAEPPAGIATFNVTVLIKSFKVSRKVHM